ncbi:unnamed protein product [Amoebophrya sp. A120]|nr:unnamed protein product [Amoebophrya sp. A120]|eukprot:GSA120T00011616001.1
MIFTIFSCRAVVTLVASCLFHSHVVNVAALKIGIGAVRVSSGPVADDAGCTGSFLCVRSSTDERGAQAAPTSGAATYFVPPSSAGAAAPPPSNEDTTAFMYDSYGTTPFPHNDSLGLPRIHDMLRQQQQQEFLLDDRSDLLARRLPCCRNVVGERKRSTLCFMACLAASPISFFGGLGILDHFHPEQTKNPFYIPRYHKKQFNAEVAREDHDDQEDGEGETWMNATSAFYSETADEAPLSTELQAQKSASSASGLDLTHH